MNHYFTFYIRQTTTCDIFGKLSPLTSHNLHFNLVLAYEFIMLHHSVGIHSFIHIIFFFIHRFFFNSKTKIAWLPLSFFLLPTLSFSSFVILQSSGVQRFGRVQIAKRVLSAFVKFYL